MSYSTYTTTGNGSNKSFTLPFSYLHPTDIIVKVGGVVTPYTYTSANVITLATAPANGVVVEITRNTPIDEAEVTFAAPGALSPALLNKNSEQVLYAVQEAKDAIVDYGAVAGAKADEAASSASAAASSAASAYTRAEEASTAAATATTKATQAASSATSAASSASTAATKASEAAASAASIVDAANTASTKASEAAASATSAAASASEAAASASNAANSASAAETSMMDAASHADNAWNAYFSTAEMAGYADADAQATASDLALAQAARVAAETARDQTLSAFDSFDDRYLGAKSTPPTVDNDGNALVAGALFFDTSADAMKVYTGSAWVAAYVSAGSSYVLKSGDTMTGPLVLPGNPTAVNDASNKGYVDTAVSNKASTNAKNTFSASQVIGSGSVAASDPVLDLSQTWNGTGVTFTGLKANITDTASNAASLLMDLQVGGTSQFKVAKNGRIYTPLVGSDTSLTAALFFSGANAITYINGGEAGRFTATAMSVPIGSSINWGNDTFLTRRAAANLRLGAADAAAPVAQTLSAQSVVAGTTNTAGANLTITGSQGTGTGAGGSIVFKVAPAGSTGTAQNALADALTISSTGRLTYGQTQQEFATSNTFSLILTGTSSLPRYTFSGASFLIGSGNSIGWKDGAASNSGTTDLILARDAANTLALRNGANAQTQRIYNTFTDTSNYERFNLSWASNVLQLGTEKLGTGVARGMDFQTDGTTRMSISATGKIAIGASPSSYELDVNGTINATNLAIGGTNLGTAATKDVGTAANNVVQLDASAKLPAVDGSQLTNLPVSSRAGRLLRAPQILTSGTIYTTPADCTAIYVELVGGGGGSGGLNPSTSEGATGGGGAGAYAAKYFTVTPNTAYTYAIGAGGTAGAASASGSAGNGGNTTFTVGATTVTAGGGSGSSNGGSGTRFGAAGGTASNGDLNVPGNGGGASVAQATGSLGVSGLVAGQGGASFFGGAAGMTSQSGGAGTFGAGAGGRRAYAGSISGLAGGDGLIRIWEYA